MLAEDPIVALGEKIGSEIVFEWILSKGMSKLGQVAMDDRKLQELGERVKFVDEWIHENDEAIFMCMMDILLNNMTDYKSI